MAGVVIRRGGPFLSSLHPSSQSLMISTLMRGRGAHKNAAAEVEANTPSAGLKRIDQLSQLNTPPRRAPHDPNLPTLTELLAKDETLTNPDYFQVHQLFTVRDLYRARVHLGHKVGSLHPNMAPFIFGSRFESTLIDLDKTAYHLRQALNFLAHVAYRKGIILWVTRSPHALHLVENTAIECGEYAHCRDWDQHTLTNATRRFGGITRLPDTILFLSTLDTVMAQHLAVTDAGKMLIPTVGVVDSNCNPNLITYPVPGNDDSIQSLQLFCSLFKEAILRGKNKRKQVDQMQMQQKEEDKERSSATTTPTPPPPPNS